MKIPVKTSVGSYDIIIENGAISKASDYLNLNRKVLVVTDSGVPEIYSKTVENQCKEAYVVTIEQGEKTKSLKTFEYLLSKLVDFGFTRGDCIVAVGGGVVGDISGFVASCFMRGIDFYNIPTTLLSQVDSSVGGKTAVDFMGLKNIVGAFYPPKTVLIDSETLKTLPKRQVSNGLAEALKMSLTSDKALFELFEKESIENNLDEIIIRSVLIKKSIVEADEKENGLRRVLNFGHTLAHAIESANEMEDILHGEAVALGMVPMCSKNVRNRLLPVLCKLSLPINNEESDFDAVIKAVAHDKKRSGNDITVVFVNEIGSFEFKTMNFSDYEQMVRQVV